MKRDRAESSNFAQRVVCMKHIILAAALLFASLLQAAEKKLLLLGDSIRMSYQPLL